MEVEDNLVQWLHHTFKQVEGTFPARVQAAIAEFVARGAISGSGDGAETQEQGGGGIAAFQKHAARFGCVCQVANDTVILEGNDAVLFRAERTASVSATKYLAALLCPGWPSMTVEDALKALRASVTDLRRVMAQHLKGGTGDSDAGKEWIVLARETVVWTTWTSILWLLQGGKLEDASDSVRDIAAFVNNIARLWTTGAVAVPAMPAPAVFVTPVQPAEVVPAAVVPAAVVPAAVVPAAVVPAPVLSAPVLSAVVPDPVVKKLAKKKKRELMKTDSAKCHKRQKGTKLFGLEDL